MEVVLRAQEQADQAFNSGILRAIVTLRWLTLGWAIVGVLVSHDHVDRPWTAAALLTTMAGFTILATALVRINPTALFHPALLVTEAAIAAVALLGDGYVFDDGRSQSLPWAWPVAVILTVGVAYGSRFATAVALALGVASYFGDARTSQNDWGVAASSKTALYVLAAVVAGYVARRLRDAEREIQAARASAEVARTLHDGVLQTLAVVQRRSEDPELAALARDQDRELRDYLFGVKANARTLPVALREVALQIQKRHHTHVDVVVADDLPSMNSTKVEAMAGAVGEALTNAVKHGEATKVVVFAEPDDESGVFCSVKDNGSGFDIETMKPGQGISGSIRARIQEVGGRVEITSRQGAGAEVRLWVQH